MSELPDLASGASAGIGSCWNTIGVRGDRSCPELKEHAHCQNCPVYSQAALVLLDRDPPADYTSEWTRHVAKPEQIAERGSESVVIFRIGAEWLALPTSVVDEIADVRPMHSLPHRRAGFVLGLANVRGELLTCVSLGQVLGLDQSARSNRERRGTVSERLLVIRREQVRTVCPVDEVYGIHHFHPRDLKDVPTTIARAGAAYSKAVIPWHEHSVGLLDGERLCAAFRRSVA